MKYWIFPLSLFFVFGCQPKSKNGIYNVLDFGAIGDSLTMNTTPFQRVLDAAHQAGGKVIIPKGDFLTGTIYLKSNTILELMPGATILGSTNIADYDSLYWGHNEDRTHRGGFQLVPYKTCQKYD